MENIKDTIEKLDEIMENLDLGESLGHPDEGCGRKFDNHTIAEFTTRSGGVSDRTKTRGGQKGGIPTIYTKCVFK
jgi:hypothetical protein